MGSYKLEDTRSGLKTLIFTDKKQYRLHSAYDPLKEAERSVDSFVPGRSSLIIVTGIALGYHIKLLKEKYPGHLIIAMEKHSEVKKIVSSVCPENIKNIHIITSVNDLTNLFEEIDISTIRGISTFIHRPSYTLFKEYYDSLLANIKEYISSRFSDLLTRFEFEENWVKNIFSNLHYIYSSIPVSALFGKFKGMPGILVSAGPSLKKNISDLKLLKNKALIASVDTALHVLQKNDISPHIVMTLDSQKHSLQHFTGLKNYDTMLLADMVSYPRIHDYYEGGKIISTTSKYYSDKNGKVKRETTPAWDWIEQFTGPIGDIQSGGSVATSVFDLFLNLGCSPIVLIGQDLAYTGREIHCTGTHHNNGWLPVTGRFLNLETINQNVIRKRKTKYVDAYGGEKKVISDFVFDIYKYWFKDSAEKVGIPVINATEGGARIQNTEEKSLRDIADSIKNPAKSPEEIIASLEKNSTLKLNNPGPLLKGISKALEELNHLKEESSEYIDNSFSDDQILEKINKSSIAKLLAPYLRKTFIYLTKHPELPQEKSSELLANDVIVSSKKLIQLLEYSKQKLEKIR
ncbi:MAG: motility associated factor glycosyltransferase family protein [Spirochaetes bacterium]|nr:motility associated factor glycosyltransferase family protein [Spirochaetota bacterium]